MPETEFGINDIFSSVKRRIFEDSYEVELENKRLLKKTSFMYMKYAFMHRDEYLNVIGPGGAGNMETAIISHFFANIPFSKMKRRYVLMNTTPNDMISAIVRFNPNETKYLHIVFVGLTERENEELTEAVMLLKNAYDGNAEITEKEFYEVERTVKKYLAKLRGGGGVFERGMKLYEKSSSFIRQLVEEMHEDSSGVDLIMTGLGGASGSTICPKVTEDIATIDRDRLFKIIVSALKPHPAEGVVKAENYRKAVSMIKPYADLYVEFDPLRDIPQNISFRESLQITSFKMVQSSQLFIEAKMGSPRAIIPFDEADIDTTLGERGKSRGTSFLLSNYIKAQNTYVKPEELITRMIPEEIRKADITPDAMIVSFEIPPDISVEEIMKPLTVMSQKLGLKSLTRGVLERDENIYNDLVQLGFMEPPRQKEIRVAVIAVEHEDDSPIKNAGSPQVLELDDLGF